MEEEDFPGLEARSKASNEELGKERGGLSDWVQEFDAT
jgi:hypothetical protein